MEETREAIKQQAKPVETARQAPTEKSPNMAHPIDSGQFGGIRGALATVREKLRTLGGVTHVPAEQIDPTILARKMEESRSDWVKSGFTQKDAVKWLNYINPDKDASPEVFQKTGVAIGQLVSSGAVEVISSESPNEPPRYRVVNDEAFLRIAHPESFKQASPTNP